MGEKVAEGYGQLPDYAIDDALQAAEDCPVGAIRVE
jgi:ferredoxin